MIGIVRVCCNGRAAERVAIVTTVKPGNRACHRTAHGSHCHRETSVCRKPGCAGCKPVKQNTIAVNRHHIDCAIAAHRHARQITGTWHDRSSSPRDARVLRTGDHGRNKSAADPTTIGDWRCRRKISPHSIELVATRCGIAGIGSNMLLIGEAHRPRIRALCAIATQSKCSTVIG